MADEETTETAEDSSSTAATTEKALMRLSRDELDEIAAEEHDLEPDEYQNKAAIVAAILAARAGDDGQRLDVKGRLEHTGKWIVQTQVRYLNTSGKAVTVSQYALDEHGVAVVDEHTGEPVANIIDDIPFDVANKLYRKGALAPHMA
jgi:hypothetical protein